MALRGHPHALCDQRRVKSPEGVDSEPDQAQHARRAWMGLARGRSEREDRADRTPRSRGGRLEWGGTTVPADAFAAVATVSRRSFGRTVARLSLDRAMGYVELRRSRRSF